ncbi:MAG: pyridoxamine 5'-phosphate oxidase family protein [Hymenobacteraceae bacterium]|nr:pyridoxamine 5'-phosphate oxidase family protein [Hymenobacteraceae bacterium]MDX5395240.1 pyridoxamine 5'-phosphate oxidase family protein [Hymenobacteraceae bacterium]MDX5511278.1 pyridoxamine 5'-phosphate oxidase family protein [Hymenobacteraceae bacterium]
MENNRQENLEKLIEKIKDVKIAMMTTIDESGNLHSRPMATQQVKEDGVLWFFTGHASGKTSEIKQDSHVNISYSKPDDNLYVSVAGKATEVRDKAKIEELWNPMMKAWFPEGKDDPNISLIKVTIESAEYWDSPNSAVVHLIGVVKATLTGEPYKTSDQKRMDL